MKKQKIFFGILFLTVVSILILFCSERFIGEARNYDSSKRETQISSVSKNLVIEPTILNVNTDEERVEQKVVEKVDLKQSFILDENIESIFSKEYEINTIFKYEKDLVYELNYPVFEDEVLNTLILEKLEDISEDFASEFKDYSVESNEESPSLTLNTDIGFFEDSILFIKFNIYRDCITYPEPVEFYETYIFDIHNKETLKVEDIFEKGYLDLFFSECKIYFFNNYGITITKKSDNYKDIEPIESNYKKMFLNDDFIEIIIYDYKLQKEVIISIQLNKILPYIKSDYIVTSEIYEILDETIEQNAEIITMEELTTTIEEVTQTTTDEVSTTESKIVRNIDKDKPMIALTFDDGPNSKSTNKILDVLEANNSVATFFVVGSRLDREQETLKRMDSLGNQIANHTFSHQKLTQLTPDQVLNEINVVNDKLKEIIGYEASMVRVPYGSTNETVNQTINYPMIMWSIDTKDWKTKNVESIKSEVIGKVRDGDIVLMHDLYETTADAVEQIVPELIKQGFQLVTVEELMEYRGIEVQPNTAYYNAR